MWPDRSRYVKRNSTVEVTSSLNALLVVFQNGSVCSCGLFLSISHWSILDAFLEDIWNNFTGKQFSSRVPGDLQEVSHRKVSGAASKMHIQFKRKW